MTASFWFSYILVQAGHHLKSSVEMCDRIIMHLQISKGLPAVKLHTEHLTDVNDNWKKLHDFSRVFGAFMFFFSSLAWNKTNLKFFDFFSDRRNPVYLSCAEWSCADQGLYLYALNGLPLLPSFLHLHWSERQVTGTRWGDVIKTAPLFEVSAGGGEVVGREEELLCCSWTPPSSIFPSLKTVHLFLT